MKEFRIKLEDFEGPIDLLLYWIVVNKLDIKKLSISQITENYIEYLNQLEKIDVNASGEFINMASRLLSIKARRILKYPTEEDIEFIQEEEEKIKREIEDRELEYINRIVDYFSFKETKQLQKFTRPLIPIFEKEEEITLTIETIKKYISPTLLHDKLKEHYIRKEEKETIAERIEKLTKKLADIKETDFFSLVEEDYTVSDIILNIVALLELAHRNIVKLYQKETMGNIIIRRIDENLERTIF